MDWDTGSIRSYEQEAGMVGKLKKMAEDFGESLLAIKDGRGWWRW